MCVTVMGPPQADVIDPLTETTQTVQYTKVISTSLLLVLG